MNKSKESLPVRAGTIMEAKVMSITGEGNPVLKLALPGSGMTRMFEAVMEQGHNVTLSRGQTVVIEVLEGKKDMRARIINIKTADTGKSGTTQGEGGAKSQPVIRFSWASGGKAIQGMHADLVKQVSDAVRSSIAKEIVTVTGLSGKQSGVTAGAVIKAQVAGLSEDGIVQIRLVPSDGARGGDGSGAVGQAGSKGVYEIKMSNVAQALSMQKGKMLFLRVLSVGEQIRAELLDSFSNTSGVRQEIPVNFLEMLADASASKLNTSEMKLFLNMIKSFPGSVKAAIPEMKVLDKSLHSIKQLDGSALKTLTRTSGIAFETKLKHAIMSRIDSSARGMPGVQGEGDLKGLMLRLRALLKDSGVVGELERNGFDTTEIAGLTERAISNIEYFQLSSKINDMFYTFLPIFFNGFRDSEFLFKKGRQDGRQSYTYDINLDLEKLGKLSVSITYMEREFYVSFFTESESVMDLINARIDELKGRFSSRGMHIKALHVNRKTEIAFGQSQREGISFRV